MSQSQWIAVYLVIGFLVYITVRGQLPQFRDAIFGGGSQGAASTSTPSGSGTLPSGNPTGSGTATDVQALGGY